MICKGDHTIIRETTIIEPDFICGSHCFIGNYNMFRPNVTIGDYSMIGHLCVFEGETTIGSKVTIQSQSHVTRGALIEDLVFIGPGFVGVNDKKMCHNRRHIIEYIETPFKILRAARIGSGAILVPGVTVGENAVIGCGAVVTKDIPDNMIAYGNPAKVVGEVPIEERL